MSTDRAADGAKQVRLFDAVRGRLVWIVLLSFVGSACAVVPFIAIAELAKTLWPALSGGPVDQGRVWELVALAAISLVIGFVVTGASGVVSHLIDNDLQLDVRTKIVRKLRQLPLGWFDDHSSGEVRKVADNDIAAIHVLVGHAIQDAVSAATTTVLALAYLFSTQWRMGLVCLAPIIVTVILYTRQPGGTSKKEDMRQYEAALAQLSSATVEFVHGIAVVKSFGQIGRSHDQYQKAVDAFTSFYREASERKSVAIGLLHLVTSPVVVLAYLAAASAGLIAAGAVTPVEVIPAILLGLGLTAPLLQAGATGVSVYGAVQGKASLTEFLSQPGIPPPSRPVEPDGHAVELEAVSFSYDGEREVLRDIAAHCAPGTTTALVGPSGSGKSTLARLVPRFYDATDGAVRIGGTDVRDIAPQRLYEQTGFVFQDSYLLRTSVRDNIRLARPEADDAAVEHAARAAQIHDRILRLPRGYDSVVGEDAQLSGGEAQRLTIARALVTDAPILVLDEATAFADPDSEAAIQTALSALAAERTLLVIAHRLHTIVGADQILVLDGGRIVERGTHAELSGAGGLYQKMWDRSRQTHTTSAEQGATL